MKNVAPFLICVCLAAVSMVGFSAGPPRAADPAVKVTDDGAMFTLSNGIVTARINKRNDDLESWTINFNMDRASQGQATLRIALAGADGQGGLTVTVNGQDVGRMTPTGTNSLRYNTEKGLWQEGNV